jgi:hypothetical protein
VVDGVPPLEDEDDPLMLVKNIIGEQKAREIEEGHHVEEAEEEPEEGPSEETEEESGEPEPEAEAEEKE